MGSTLAQRLRAARNYADLRQQDIADACALAGYKLSRSAVAQWEYDDDRRTLPSIDCVKVVAKRTGVPLDYLLNDRAEASFTAIAEVVRHGAPAPIAPEPKSPVTDRFSDAYSKAIEFAVLQRKPELAPGFGQVIGQGQFAAQPDFMWKNIVAEFKTHPVGADTVGQMLMLEQAAGGGLTKVVILLDGTASAPYDVFGIRVYPVPSPDVAAEKLISLCK